jgi:hypothetical protein
MQKWELILLALNLGEIYAYCGPDTPDPSRFRGGVSKGFGG